MYGATAAILQPAVQLYDEEPGSWDSEAEAGPRPAAHTVLSHAALAARIRQPGPLHLDGRAAPEPGHGGDVLGVRVTAVPGAREHCCTWAAAPSPPASRGPDSAPVPLRGPPAWTDSERSCGALGPEPPAPLLAASDSQRPRPSWRPRPARPLPGPGRPLWLGWAVFPIMSPPPPGPVSFHFL